MDQDDHLKSESFGCIGCLGVIVTEVFLIFFSLIMAAFASDSPKSTDKDIYQVFLLFFGGRNLLGVLIYMLYKRKQKNKRSL